MSDILNTEKAYWSKDIANLLNISDSTLRKYCIILEKNGYVFNRGDNSRRAFLERDLFTLKKIKELMQNDNLTLNDAAIAVIPMAKKANHVNLSTIQKNTLTKTYGDRFNKYENKINQIIEQNEQLKRELNLIYQHVAATNEKVSAFITETRSEKHKKKWWKFW